MMSERGASIKDVPYKMDIFDPPLHVLFLSLLVRPSPKKDIP